MESLASHLWRSLLLSWVLLMVGLPAPAGAHLMVQLFQGAEQYRGAVIRSAPQAFDPKTHPRMPNGLFRSPPQFKIEVELREGPHKGQRVTVDHILYGNPSVDIWPRVGLRVIVSESLLTDGCWLYRLIDYDRRPALAGMTLVALLVLLLAGRQGASAAAIALGGLALLFWGMDPPLLHGYPPLLVFLLAAVVIMVGTSHLILRDALARRAALLGGSVGVAATMGFLAVAYAWARVSGLATADALVLYSQVSDSVTLDYRLIWEVGAGVTALGGLVALSTLTARAIAEHPAGDPWRVGWQEARALLPAFTIGSGMLYFGMSMPMMLVFHVNQVTSVRVSSLRYLNFDYMVSLLLAWESSLVGLVAAGAATAWIAAAMRRRTAG